MISLSNNLHPSCSSQISYCTEWQSPKLSQLKQSKKINDSLKLLWEKKSKDTDFIADLKKQPDLINLIRYDTRFNNKRKVEFESSLAGLIRFHPRMLHAPVVKVAKAISTDLILSLVKSIYDTEENWLHQHLYKFLSENCDIMAEYTGAYKGKISASLKEKINFILWVYNKLHSLDSKDFHCQLLLIREYGNFFLRPFSHLPQFKGLNEGQGIQILPGGIGDEFNKIKMKRLWDESREAINKICSPLNSRIATNRSNHILINTCGIFDSQSTYCSKHIKKWCPKISVHLPGKNLWFVNSASDFTKRVRFDLDMPLIASQGGSIALLLIPAIVMGNLDDCELRLFNLAAISYMISNGHHSLHEFRTVWNTFNIPYIDGDYKSLFPNGLIESYPELLELQKDFWDLFPSLPSEL